MKNQLRIEVRPAAGWRQWRCNDIEDCPVRGQWHVVHTLTELNTQALGHAEQEHGEKAWLHFAGGES